jgi:hypothetical protein
MGPDPRRAAPSTARNKDPIWAVLQPELPAAGLVVEVASGAGEHAVHFAHHSPPELIFQPTDPDAGARASIDAWTAALGLENVRPALDLDASSAVWPVIAADAIVCINMVHISPWAATEGLIRGAARVLSSDGLLYLYGPYKRGGVHTAPSNDTFDADLRSRNPAWGVRDVEVVAALAQTHGFGAPHIVDMPANNLSVLIRRVR